MKRNPQVMTTRGLIALGLWTVAAMYFAFASVVSAAPQRTGPVLPLASDVALSAPIQAVDAPASDDRAKRVDAVKSYLRHIYSVYLGIRSCTEMSAQQKDQSFLPSVSLDQARKALKAIDTATSEVGVNSNETWAVAAPLAEVTAEALKVNPAKNLTFCQRMGSLFRIDRSNLQELLRTLGAKTILIQKDY